MKYLLLTITLRSIWRDQVPVTEPVVVNAHSIYRTSTQSQSPHTIRCCPSTRNPTSYFSYHLPPVKRRRNHGNKFERDDGLIHLSSVPNDGPFEEEATSIDQVDELRRRAAALRQEAHLLELSLEESKIRKKNKKEADIQSWINLLFVDSTHCMDGDHQLHATLQPESRPLPDASTVARTLQRTNLSQEQMIMIMRALYQRRNLASLAQPPPSETLVLPNESNISYRTSTGTTMGIASNPTQADLMGQYMQLLLDAISILDQSDEQNDSRISRPRWSDRFSSQLASKLNEWSRMDELQIRRQMDVQLVRVQKEMDYNNNDNNETSSTILDETVARNHENVVQSAKYIPRWIPPALYTTVLLSEGTSNLDPSDILAIKERVLTKSRFFCTSSDSFMNIAIYRGNMRPGSTEANLQNFTAVAFDEIQRRLELEGLANRTQLFLLNDPEWRANADIRDTGPKPVIVALPKELIPYESSVVPSRRVNFIREMSPVLAVCTTILFSIGCYALNPIVFDGIVNRHDISVLSKCIPIMTIMLGVQGIHEVAHQILARKYKIMTHWPIPIPSTALGSFGCITRIRSFPPTRTALFDFAMSGPLAATTLALSLMIIGCFKTIHASTSILMTYPTVPLAKFKSSFLTGAILTVMLPKAMMMPSAHPIPIHPFFVGGYATLITTALNMLPIFRLDGGRACTAIVGTRLGALTSAWTLLSLLSLALSGSRMAWAWVTFVLLFQRQPEIVSKDDVTPVDKRRTIIWGTCLVLSILALVPFPGGTFL